MSPYHFWCVSNLAAEEAAAEEEAVEAVAAAVAAAAAAEAEAAEEVEAAEEGKAAEEGEDGKAAPSTPDRGGTEKRPAPGSGRRGAGAKRLGGAP